jgi:hypothetical protein
MAKQRALVFILLICSVLSSSARSYAKEKITFTPKKGAGHSVLSS